MTSLPDDDLQKSTLVSWEEKILHSGPDHESLIQPLISPRVSVLSERVDMVAMRFAEFLSEHIR